MFFTSGGTEANNLVINGCLNGLGIKNIITSRIEHKAVLKTSKVLAEHYGASIHYLSVNDKGQISLEELECLLQKNRNCLVSLMHANNEISVLNPVQKIGELCRKYDAYFHSDMVQAVGHYKLDLKKLNVDFSSSSAHKFHGPKAAGFCYVNKDRVRIPSQIIGGSQERNLRAGTENVTGICGLVKALEVAEKSMQKDRQYIEKLKERMISGLNTIHPEFKFLGTSDNEGLYTVLSVLFPSFVKHDTLVMRLDMKGVEASGGSACASGVQKQSHVIEQILNDEKAAVIRFSFSKMNTIEEVDFALNVVDNIINKEK